MIVLLEANDSFGGPRKIQLRSGQVATVGRTEHADFSFPDDRTLGPCHLEIDCQQEACVVRGLTNEQLLVNGTLVDSAVLVSGDRIRAGNVTFDVTVSGVVAAVPEVEESQAAVAAVAVPATICMVELCDYLELDAGLHPLADQHSDQEALIDALIDAKQFHPALRVRAHSLICPQAVWWACLCVEQTEPLTLNDNDCKALKAAQAWAQDPNDTARRIADDAATATGPAGAAGLIAMAAFYGGGSLGPADMDPVEPDPRACGSMIAGALMLAGYCDARHAEARIVHYLTIAKQIIAGELALPATAILG